MKLNQGTVIRAFVVLAVIGIVVQTFTIVEGARLINALQTRQQTQCRWYLDVGNVASAPVAVGTATHTASKIGIAAIADSRAAFRGLGCAGELGQPSPSFSHWATIYHLPSD